jgi:hypothetical protein
MDLPYEIGGGDSRPPLLFATRHFVVRGHDIYHEILADGFSRSRD